MKKITLFFGITLLDLLVLIFIAAALPLFTWIIKENLLDALSSILVLYCLYFAAKGNIVSFIFGVLYGAVFGIVCYFRGLFALAMMNWIYTIPMQIVCMIAWLRNRGKETVNARRLNAKWRAILLTSIVLICAAIACILYFLLDSKYAVVDSTVTVLHACSLLLLILRYMESWWISAVAYFVNIILWIVSLYFGASSITLLLTTIVSFLIAVKGVVNWYKLTQKQSKQKEES